MKSGYKVTALTLYNSFNDISGDKPFAFSNGSKISFRSKNIFPCDKFAKKFFNGGGHKNAAGGKYTGTIDDAVEKFKKSLTDFNF